MVIALPNEWSQLDKAELQERVEALAKATVGENRDYQWAVHWNTARTNLHVHVIFSERQREKEPGRWDRDVYLAYDGKIARRKADRAVDSDGNYVLLHRKGELKEGFTAKDSFFKDKSWLHNKKAELKDLMADRWAVQFEKPQLLHEYHEGNGSEAPVIKEKNELIRQTNEAVKKFERQERPLTSAEEKALRKYALDGVKQGYILHIEPRGDDVALAHQKPQKAPERPQEAPERVYQPQTKAEQLRAAFEDFKAARTKVDEAADKLHHAGDGLKFWQFKAKKAKQLEAGRELRTAESECRSAFDRVTGFGISRYRDGVELNGTNLDSAEFASIRQHVERKAEEFERQEAHEGKNRSSGKTDIEAVSEAVQRYREKQKEMAPAVETRMKEKAQSQSRGPER